MLVTINLAGTMSNPISDTTHDFFIRKSISANDRVVIVESDAGDLVAYKVVQLIFGQSLSCMLHCV